MSGIGTGRVKYFRRCSIKKGVLTQFAKFSVVFFFFVCEFWEIFKNIFLYRTPLGAYLWFLWIFSKPAARSCSVEQMFWKISQNSKKGIWAEGFLLMKFSLWERYRFQQKQMFGWVLNAPVYIITYLSEI